MTTMIDNEQKTLNVPNLRFPEFEGEWEECRLGEIGKLYKGVGISKDQLSDNGEPCILYGELYTKYKSEVINEVISKTNISDKKLVRSNANDVIIPCSGETAEDIATARCVLNDNVLLGGDLNIIRLHKDNGLFMSYQLNGKRKYDIARVSQGVSVVHLYGEHLKGIKTYCPNLDEQNKIATFLSLLDERIATQNKIIEELKKLKVCVRRLIFRTLNCSWFLLSELEASGDICLKRGNIIPKHEHTDIFCYPVYSSSVQNGGLMGYNNTYMFNTELVTWSIDGGGNFFYRHKHKFNVTNVSGYMQLNEAKYNYRFVSEILLWQHSFMVFDYQTKAHPSVIRSIYKLPDVSLAEQELIANIFRLLDVKLQNEMTILKQYQQQKQYLLCQMFI
ncbi:restriction endonuclease subunit S [Hallella colorans]|uniref:Restriction endonuclease S subunit n=1 Tax=Hallella colorans TaxID=1703337 RepID=A0A2U0UPC1_9BACT|nr:restriction endonuclease subunit S [Hallella colorans]PVX59435.1 restriction endonuclease S subunit [Hallella colorans]